MTAFASRVTTVIADDEPLARRRLHELLGEVPWISLVGEAADGVDAVRLIDQLRPDLIFLDVMMPGLSGLEVLSHIQHHPTVVFTTAYDRFAVAAFEARALDYILKPFGRRRFASAPRAHSRVGDQRRTPSVERARDALARCPLSWLCARTAASPGGPSHRRPLRGERRLRHDPRGRAPIARESQDERSRIMLPPSFLRIHRSHIVNLRWSRPSRRRHGPLHRRHARWDAARRHAIGPEMASRAGNMMPRALKSWGWETLTVCVILAACAAANVLILAGRPAMTRTAMRTVDSALMADRERLGRDLGDWRRGMIDDGRWAAQLAALALDGSRRSVDSLVVTQIPTARLWLVHRDGRTRTLVGGDPLKERHTWLASQSLARDTTLVAVTEALDATCASASRVRCRTSTPDGQPLLDRKERLLRRIPRLSMAGKDARVALTFPFEGGFVGTTWMRDATAPMISWPRDGWTLSDTSLAVRGGALPDTTPRFQLGISRDASRVMASSVMASRATIRRDADVRDRFHRPRRSHRTSDAQRSLAESRLLTQAESAATRASLAAIQARLTHFLQRVALGVRADHRRSRCRRRGPRSATRLFRYTSDCSERQMVRLADEWKFVRDYLEIGNPGSANACGLNCTRSRACDCGFRHSSCAAGRERDQAWRRPSPRRWNDSRDRCAGRRRHRAHRRGQRPRRERGRVARDARHRPSYAARTSRARDEVARRCCDDDGAGRRVHRTS
jgi:two-component system LytT family response regulator